VPRCIYWSERGVHHGCDALSQSALWHCLAQVDTTVLFYCTALYLKFYRVTITHAVRLLYTHTTATNVHTPCFIKKTGPFVISSYLCFDSYKLHENFQKYRRRKIYLTLQLWPWPLTCNLENLFDNVHSYVEHMCQISQTCLH